MVGAFDFNGDGGLALFAEGDGAVFALDCLTGAEARLVAVASRGMREEIQGWVGNLHSTQRDDFFHASNGVRFDHGQWCQGSQVTLDDIDADDDRVFLVKYGDGL